uniref:N-acetylmuramidase family protein n=1 Tax=Ralstonia sp. ASV6 TaxID=2795124 RepID=UPI0018EC46CA
SRLIIKHESEWANPDKWKQLTGAIEEKTGPKAQHNAEQQRIEKLVWWEAVKAKLPSLPDSDVFHIQPGALVGNFLKPNTHPVILINGEKVELEFLIRKNKETIDENDYIAAAQELNCEVAAIKAVAASETGSSGSYYHFPEWDDVPAILYERHYFHQLTSGAYDNSNPDISNASSGGYGIYSAQYGKLLRAYRLNKSAALKSASWGKFQIMGRNHGAAGYESVENFVAAMSQSEKNHLMAFVSFIKADPFLLTAIRAKNWHNFAVRYNGSAQSGYDTKMSQNYNAISSQN